MLRTVFLCICFVVSGMAFMGASEKERRKDDKKLLTLLRYTCRSPRGFSGKGVALSRVRKLRALLKGGEGKKGREGKRGAHGEKGSHGKRGPMGLCGKKGPAGPMGKKGPRGEKGEAGLIGPQGQRGMCGPTGERGPAGAWETQDGELTVTFRPVGNTGAGFWQAIVISPSGKTYVSGGEEASSEDVRVSISPVELGVYTLCWKNGFEGAKPVHVLKEIEVDSSAFNGDHVFYKRLVTSKRGEQRTLAHVVISEIFK